MCKWYRRCVQEFTVSVTEEFMDHCSEGALSIEVWGHRSAGFAQLGDTWDHVAAKSKTIADRYELNISVSISKWFIF